MWRVSPIPFNYHTPNNEQWCIIDEDGDIHDFYCTREDAENALVQLLAK